MNEDESKKRTKTLALRVIRLVEALPQGRIPDVIGWQLLRSANSVGANYRAACRGRSASDMIARQRVVEEEADETLYWLELLAEADLVPEARLADLTSETNQIVAMTVASIKTLRRAQATPESTIQNRK